LIQKKKDLPQQTLRTETSYLTRPHSW